MLHSKDLHSKFAHHEGIGQVSFHPSGNEIFVCGSDGDIRTYDINLEPKNEITTFDNSTYTFCFSKNGDQLACGGEDQKVGLFTAPNWQMESTLTRFDCGIYHLAFSPSGKILAAAADTPSIKLINVSDSSKFEFLQGKQSGFKSVCFDPKEEFIASADCSRSLRIWQLDNKELVYEKEHFPSIPDASNAEQMLRLDWHPSGEYLALPGQENIQCLNRKNWNTKFTLGDPHSGDGHSKPVSVLAFSPNGFYLASAGEDLKLIVWNLRSKKVINTVVLEHPATSISWSPEDNILIYMTALGFIYKLPSVISMNMPDPFTVVDGNGDNENILPTFNDTDKTMQSTNASDLADFRDIEDMDDSDSDDNVNEQFGRKRRLKTLAQKNESQYYTRDELYGNRERREKEMNEKMKDAFMNDTPGLSSETLHYKPPDYNLQPVFQVSSTPEFPKRRSGHFLAWNLEVSITTAPDEDEEGNVISHQIEILFSDTAANKPIRFRDHYNFVMGALGERGAVFASQIHITEARPGQKGDYRQSVVYYRPFSSWAQNSSWTIHLEEKEDALCIATNAKTVAVATSFGYIRFFSFSGREKLPWSINPSEPIVTMTGRGDFIVVVSHAGLPTSGNQNLSLMLINTKEESVVQENKVSITPKSTLTWVYLTENRVILTMDSAGIVRCMLQKKSNRRNPLWVPILDTNRCKKKQRSEHFWPVGLIESSLMCARCMGKRYPLAKPRPVLDAVPLQIPLLSLRQNPDIDLEEKHMRKGFFDCDGRGYGRDRSTKNAMDKMILKLMDSAINTDMIVRALDLSTDLQTYRAFTLALTLVQHRSQPALAERINLIMQNKFPNGPPRKITRQPNRMLTPTPTPTPTPTLKDTATSIRPTPTPTRTLSSSFSSSLTSQIRSEKKKTAESPLRNIKKRKIIGRNRFQRKQQSSPVSRDTPIKLPKKSNPFSLRQ